MSLTPGARLGVYEIVGLIGAGGMGEVYRARDGRLHRDVAIKVLPASVSGDPERRDRFEQEARAAAALSHPVTMTATALKLGTPVRLFETAGGADIEAAPDGKRFLMNAPVQSPSLVTILVNWSGDRR